MDVQGEAAPPQRERAYRGLRAAGGEKSSGASRDTWGNLLELAAKPLDLLLRGGEADLVLLVLPQRLRHAVHLRLVALDLHPRVSHDYIPHN
jgi:hypothetical protein